MSTKKFTKTLQYIVKYKNNTKTVYVVYPHIDSVLHKGVKDDIIPTLPIYNKEATYCIEIECEFKKDKVFGVSVILFEKYIKYDYTIVSDEFTNIFCPICDTSFTYFSKYLYHIFYPNYHTYAVACLVTHYRTFHISYYHNTVTSESYANNNPEFLACGKDVEKYKQIVNNRAKRVLAKAFYKSSLSIEEKVAYLEGIFVLEHNDKKTMTLVTNLLEMLKIYTINDECYNENIPLYTGYLSIRKNLF